jgi:TPR repeat protein
MNQLSHNEVTLVSNDVPHKYKFTLMCFGTSITLFLCSQVFSQTLSNDELIRSAFEASANGNLAEAFSQIEIAAKRGDMREEFLLGELYENGDYPNAPTASISSSSGPTYSYREGDIQTSVMWYRKAATQGLAEAQAKMGCFFETSPFSPEEGYKWAQAGAAQNNAEATAYLAIMHFFGIDDLTGARMAPRNIKKALALFEKAACRRTTSTGILG